jgi:hypothetical protein
VYHQQVARVDGALVAVLQQAIDQRAPFPALRTLVREHAPRGSYYYLELHPDSIALMQSGKAAHRFALTEADQLRYHQYAAW